MSEGMESSVEQQHDEPQLHGGFTRVDTEDFRNSDIGAMRPSSSSSSFVVNEFVQSEESYRAALDVLWQAYIQPLFNVQDDSPLMMSFGADLLSVIACHRLINQQLDEQQARSNGSDISFTETLLLMAPSLQRSYTNYVMNFARNSTELERARQLVADDVWISGMCAIAQGMKDQSPLLHDVDVTFNSLVAMPMQRLVRYSLLCNEFIKQFDGPESAPELVTAAKAADAIQQLCAAVNESKQMMINTRKLMEIERSYFMYGLSADPDRRLLNEGRFLRATKQGNAYKFRTCHVFLFNDKLVVAKLGEDPVKRVVKRIDELPLACVSSVRNLQSDTAHRYTESLRGILIKHSDPYKTSDVVHELLLVDDDDLNINIWIKEITFAVDKRMFGSPS